MTTLRQCCPCLCDDIHYYGTVASREICQVGRRLNQLRWLNINFLALPDIVNSPASFGAQSWHSNTPLSDGHSVFKNLSQFLGAFVKLWKATISFVISVCLSVYPSLHLHGPIQLPIHGFSQNLILEYFATLSWKKNPLEPDGITGTVHDYQYLIFIIFRSILLRTSYVSRKTFRENQNTLTCSIIFFSPKIVSFMIMWKNVVQLDRPHRTICCISTACWITKATDTHSEYVILTVFPLQQ